MAHLLKNGHPAHVFTLEDCSKGGRAKAAKYAAEVKERRRRRRRARYLAERAGRPEWRTSLAASTIGPDERLCPSCGGVRRGRIGQHERLCRCAGY